MGFDTVIASLIVISFIITMTYIFIASNYNLVEMSSNEYRKMIDIALERLNTRINITEINYDNSTYTVTAYIKNVGSTKFDDFSKFNVFIYGSAEGYNETYYPAIDSVSFTITSELINPGIFDPQEVAKVEINLKDPLPNGTYVVFICTPNGVCCSGEFLV